MQLMAFIQMNGFGIFRPYQLYCSRDQLKESYPQIDDFFVAKR